MDAVRQIAAAVLYEGYVLWPYRRGAIKNQRRWTFGGVYPRAYSEHQAGSDPWTMRTECLVAGTAPVLEVTPRFLHVVQRRVGRRTPMGGLEYVDELHIGGERYLAWDEATEREVPIAGLRLADLETGMRIPIHVPVGSDTEALATPDGVAFGALVRTWSALDGMLEVSARPVRPGLFRATVSMRNDTSWAGSDREDALKRTFVATHFVLRVRDGEFISLMDPPPDMKSAAETCEQVKLWPVLVGDEGDRHTLLAAPIILYDYPRIAPESPGDLFDGTEIDQLLTLSILALTDEEKAEMRATDPRVRAILERSEALTAYDFMRLHGAIRDFQTLGTKEDLPPVFAELETPGPDHIVGLDGEVRPGSRVRLRPRPGGDIFDLALAGRVATVEAIELDYDGQVHLAVTIADDPGQDLGRERQIGHRFFFAPDEVEPIASDRGAP